MKNTKKTELEQLNFFFWLGEDGLQSVSEEEFNEKQEKWDGIRPRNS